MAASTVNIVGKYRPSQGKLRRIKMAAEYIPYGAMVMINAAGFAANQTDTVNTFFYGVAVEEMDNSDGAAGDLKIMCDIGGASVRCTHEDSLTDANVGDAVVQEFNNEVTSAGTGTNDISVGRIEEVISANDVWISCKAFGA